MEQLALTARALRLRRTSDEAILTRTLDGDPAAFVELHRRFRPRVESVCASKTDDTVSAEDAVQETFLRVLRAAPRTVENAEAWLMTVARNVCIDLSRRASRVETPADAESVEFAAGLPAADSATELMRRENARQVFLALRRLPTRYRTAITLREFHGMSSAEIAESMGTTVSAVDPLVSRARDAFGAAYAEVSGFPDACRGYVERIYRATGTGITAAEQAELDLHVKTCARCRAELARTSNPRYAKALMPLIAVNMPSVTLFADALNRASFAPGVMQSFPVVTVATTVAAVGTALALSPLGVGDAVSGRIAANSAAETSQATAAVAHNADGAAHEETTPDAEAFAVATGELPDAAAGETAVAKAPEQVSGGTSERPAASAPGPAAVAPKPAPGDAAPPQATPAEPEPKPAPEPEPAPDEDAGGWGEPTPGAVIVDLETPGGDQ